MRFRAQRYQVLKEQYNERTASSDHGKPDRFFDTIPERRKVVSDFSNRLKPNWKRRMRRELQQHIEQQCGGNLNHLVLDALRLYGGILK